MTPTLTLTLSVQLSVQTSSFCDPVFDQWLINGTNNHNSHLMHAEHTRVPPGSSWESNPQPSLHPRSKQRKSLHGCSSRSVVFILCQSEQGEKLELLKLLECWMKHLNFIHKIKWPNNVHINNLLIECCIESTAGEHECVHSSCRIQWSCCQPVCVSALVQYHN